MEPEVQNPALPVGQPGEPKTGEPVPKSWRDAIPKEHQGAKTLDKFRGNTWDEVGPQVVSSYINLEKAYGGSVRIPGEGAKPEEIADFHRKMGVPESPDKYDVKAAVPEGLPWDAENEKAFLKTAHTQGLTAKQAKGLLDWYVTLEQKGLDYAGDEAKKGIEDGWNALSVKWGANTERNVAIAQRTVLEMGGPELAARLEEVDARTGKPLGNDPALLTFLYRVGDMMLEHGFIKGDTVMLTTKSAQAEITTIMNDPKHPYFVAKDPGHADAVKKVAELYGIAYPEGR